MSSLQSIIINDIKEGILSKIQEKESIVASILENKFGVKYENTNDIKSLIKQKKLAILYSYEGEIIGIISNNRWLYTTDGKIIGKKGRRYKIEEIMAAK